MGVERGEGAGSGSGMGAGSFIVSQCVGWIFCEFFERGEGKRGSFGRAPGEYPCSWEGYGKDDCQVSVVMTDVKSMDLWTFQLGGRLVEVRGVR